MKVSIITVVYNNEAYIRECIESVLRQSYQNIEHIVIDGGSTDGTQDVIEKYKNKLAYYISEKDNGLYHALNKGLKKVTGDIVGLLHSDDIFSCRNTIQNIVNSFKTSGADLVYAKGIYAERNNLRSVKRIYPGRSFKNHNLYLGWIPLHTTIYVKRELFDRYGLYDESYTIAGDYEISLRWLSNPEIKKFYLDQYVVVMRLGGKSTTLSLQKTKSYEDYRIIQKYNLIGAFTLGLKIAQKIPQFIKSKEPFVVMNRNNLSPKIELEYVSIHQVGEVTFKIWQKIPL